MNNSRAPLNKLLVRRAINYAINRKALIKTAYAGYGKLIGTHSSPADPWYLDLSNTYPYDPAKARKLLAQAGYAKGFSLTMQLPPVNYAQQSGTFIQSELGQVGIKVKIQNIDFPLWINRVFIDGELRRDDHRPRRGARPHQVRRSERTTGTTTTRRCRS